MPHQDGHPNETKKLHGINLKKHLCKKYMFGSSLESTVPSICCNFSFIYFLMTLKFLCQASCILVAGCLVRAASFQIHSGIKTNARELRVPNLNQHNKATNRIHLNILHWHSSPQNSLVENKRKQGLYMSTEDALSTDGLLPLQNFTEPVDIVLLKNENVFGSAKEESGINGNTRDISNEDSESKGDDTVEKIASYRELVVFVGMTVIIWLSEPSLSLVDTTLVGKFASSFSSSAATASQSLFNGVSPETVQLAALGPATMLSDNLFYGTYFLAMATTNQLARASAQNDRSLQVKSTSHALGVAAVMGLMIAITIFGMGDTLLRQIIGTGGAMVNGVDLAKPVLEYSWDYCKIRSVVAPLSVMGMISQSVSLATLDTRTPGIAVLVAILFNVFGDIFLVASCGMGIRGAAYATAAASVASSLLLLGATRNKVNKWRTSQDKTPFVSLPDMKSFITFVKLGGPMCLVILAKVVCYSAMTMKASDFGMLPLATHNIMMRVFFFCCTFGDSFAAAAQSFVPRALYRNIKNEEADISVAVSIPDENKELVNIILKRILATASVVAMVSAVMSTQVMQRGGSFFTNDWTILSLLKNPSRKFYIGISTLVHPIVMSLEGTLLSTGELKFLVGAYGVTVTMLLSLLKYSTNTFTHVWRTLFIFQSIRLVALGSRVWKKTRKTS